MGATGKSAVLWGDATAPRCVVLQKPGSQELQNCTDCFETVCPQSVRTDDLVCTFARKIQIAGGGPGIMNECEHRFAGEPAARIRH
jgi:hypothetical protein